jgi:hypothetical protein
MTAPVETPSPPVIVPPPVPSDVFYCDSEGNRWDGVISLYGLNLPPGVGTVTRIEPDNSQFVVRGGQAIRTDHPFVLSDTEAQFDIPNSYILKLVPDTRAVFHNWFVNPNFENATPTLSWLATANRNLSTYNRSYPAAPYGSKVLSVSGYGGSPPIGSAIPAPIRTNLFTKPSFEDGLTTGFTPTNSTLSVVTMTAPPNGGTKALQSTVTATAAWAITTTNALFPPVVVGKLYRASMYVKSTAAGAAQVRLDANYRDSTGNNNVGSVYSSSIITLTTSWQRIEVTLLAAPAGAASIKLNLITPSTLTAGRIVQMDAILVEEIAAYGVVTGAYFDGNSPAVGTFSHAWTGTANASTSLEGVAFPTSTTAQRVLMFTKPDAALTFATSTKYRVSGRVNVVPRLYSWAEARSNPATTDPIGTMTAPPARDWNNAMFDSGGHSWQEVLGYPTDETTATTGTLYVAFCNSSGALMSGASLTKAAVLTSYSTTDTVDFAVELTTPATAMSNAYIGFYQGDGTLVSVDPITGGTVSTPDPGEFQRQWLFDGLMLDVVHTDVAPLPYFDGSNPLDSNVHGLGYTVSEFDPYSYAWDSGDATFAWMGAANNSATVFNGASVLGAYTGACTLVSREYLNGHVICEPVFISDPIIPSYSEWLGLLSIGPIAWAPRRELMDILGRHAPIAMSQYRATPSTEFTFITNTLAERLQFITIINAGRILLLRNPDPQYPENMWYISIGDVSEERIAQDHRIPIRRWVVSAQVVDRPSGLLTAITGQSWQNVNDTYTDWDEVDTENDSWLSVLIGPATLPGTFNAESTLHGSTPTVQTVAGPAWEPVP